MPVVDGVRGELVLETPLIGGEIVAVNGKLGIQLCYEKCASMAAGERAVICCREDRFMNWDVICNRLRVILRLNQPLLWCQLDVFRCVMLSDTLEMATMLVNLRLVQVRGERWVELFKWSPDVNGCWTVAMWELRRIWVCGLLLHLWSLGFFRAIGGLCGGFVRVEKETRLYESLDTAWIWIKGGLGERIPRVISLFDRGKKFKLEIMLGELEKTSLAWLAGRMATEEAVA